MQRMLAVLCLFVAKRRNLKVDEVLKMAGHELAPERKLGADELRQKTRSVFGGMKQALERKKKR